MGKENSTITAIALVGRRAASVLERNGVPSDRFVLGVSHGGEDVVNTPLGKVGVAYSLTNNGDNRQVTLDISDVSAIQGLGIHVSVNSKGEGSQHVARALEIVVVTSADLEVFKQNQR